jgi:archaellum biogenesis ATPase FlaH
LEDIREYLESKDLQVKERGSENISTHCMFCDEDPSKPGRLYINVDEAGDKYGVFFCFLCQAKGNYNTIRQHYGDPLIHLDPVVTESNPIFDIATKYYEDQLLKNPQPYKYLTDDRGLHDETIRKARLGWADGGLCNHLVQQGFDPEDIKSTGLVNRFGEDFFHNQITFPYLEYGVARSIRGKGIGKKTISLPGELPIPYGLDTILGEKTVSVCEGEIDTLTMHQLGFPTIGIPGALTFKNGWEEHFDTAKRIYTILDQDKAGKAGAEKIAGILGPRVRVVELPKKGIDVNDWYLKYGKNADDFEYLMRKAKGGLLISIEEAMERWTEIEGNPHVDGLRFGIEEIDSAMDFGLIPGQIMTMIARTGNGKTIWTLNLLHRMRLQNPEIKILFLSLEQTRNEWFERAHRIHNFYEPGASVIDTVNFWKNNMYIVDKNRVTEDQLVDSIDQFQYEMGTLPDFTVIDYLGYYARSFSGNNIEKVSDAIMGAKAIAKDFGLAMFLPHQANRTNTLGTRLSIDQAKDAATVEETSDIMLTLWRPDQHEEAGDEAAGQVRQEIVKTRQGGYGTLIKYIYAPLTFAIIPSSDPLYSRVLQERQFALAGDDWKKAVNRHLTGDMDL